MGQSRSRSRTCGRWLLLMEADAFQASLHGRRAARRRRRRRRRHASRRHWRWRWRSRSIHPHQPCQPSHWWPGRSRRNHRPAVRLDYWRARRSDWLSTPIQRPVCQHSRSVSGRRWNASWTSTRSDSWPGSCRIRSRTWHGSWCWRWIRCRCC